MTGLIADGADTRGINFIDFILRSKARALLATDTWGINFTDDTDFI
jgi:hypothetical protein